MQLLALLLTIAVTTCVPKEDTMTKPKSRNVTVHTDNGKGSGVIIAQGLVLSTFHLIQTDSEVYVNGQVARIVKVDPKNDLILLLVETDFVSPIEMSEVKLDEEIIIYGNPLHHTNMVLRGRVIDLANEYIYTDAHLFFGSSGGGAYNLEGKFVGLVHAVEGKDGSIAYGVIIPASTVFAFLTKE